MNFAERSDSVTQDSPHEPRRAGGAVGMPMMSEDPSDLARMETETADERYINIDQLRASNWLWR